MAEKQKKIVQVRKHVQVNC